MADFYKPELATLQPNWGDKAPQSVQGMFTLRTGGVSSGPFGGVDGIMGLNLADHTGDNAGCVRMNRDIVAQLLPNAPTYLKQVHSTQVVQLPCDADAPIVADAAVTTEPIVVCAVMVADCLPVLFTSKEGTVVGAAHAGWRGLCDGVLEATVVKMRELDPKSEGLLAWFGPHIGMYDFEVGMDVFEAFKKMDESLDINDGVCFKKLDQEGKLLCNLSAIAKKRLNALGIQNEDIFVANMSTASHPNECFSYRRDGEKSGRHVALIWKNQ